MGAGRCQGVQGLRAADRRLRGPDPRGHRRRPARTSASPRRWSSKPASSRRSGSSMADAGCEPAAGRRGQGDQGHGHGPWSAVARSPTTSTTWGRSGWPPRRSSASTIGPAEGGPRPITLAGDGAAGVRHRARPDDHPHRQGRAQRLSAARCRSATREPAATCRSG